MKADEPTISLCIMIPKGFGAWRTCLHGMKVLKEYRSGDCVFADANAPLKQAMHILFDPPAHEFDPQARLRMLVQAVVHGFTVNALLDSGSTNSCISKDIVSSGMLETSTTSTREVRAFNGSKQKTSTSCTIELTMNKYKEQVTLMVIDMSFDVNLGQDWFKKHRASLHFDGPDAAYFRDECSSLAALRLD